MSEEKKDLVITDDLKPVLEMLKPEDASAVVELREELSDNWQKKQIFRTETEMRISVLNDAKHPTKASKYWQAVREMSSMFDSLLGLSFDLRRHSIMERRLMAQMERAMDEGDDMLIEELQISIDESAWGKANMMQTATDRVRELSLWSKIKSELDDGSFNKEDVNEHQAVSYAHRLENRVRALSEHSEPSEVLNAAGPLQTLQRLATEDGKLLKFDEKPKLAGGEVKKIKE